MSVIHRLTAVIVAVVSIAPAIAQAAQFDILSYRPRTENVISCPVNLECDITLEPGETVYDGFAASPDDWDPHSTYTGPKGNTTPHLIFRPSRAGLRTNVIVPTSRRTYYLRLESTDSTDARYYTYSFPRVFISRKFAEQQSKAPGAAIVTAPDTDPTHQCLSRISYQYQFDRGLPQDHPTGARSNYASLTALWQPRKVCTDGLHTFVSFAPTDITPSDTPVLQLLGPEGDTMLNYTYDAQQRFFRVDGVPDAFVLEFGSQASPLRLVIRRNGTDGTTFDPKAKH